MGQGVPLELLWGGRLYGVGRWARRFSFEGLDHRHDVRKSESVHVICGGRRPKHALPAIVIEPDEQLGFEQRRPPNSDGDVWMLGA